MKPQGWFPNWEPRRIPTFDGWARHMRIQDIVYFQHVLYVYQEIPGVSAWQLPREEAAKIMAQDDLWHQPEATPCWQADSIARQDLAFLSGMRITMED